VLTSAGQPLLPTGAARVSFRVQGAEASRGQANGERPGLGGERLVPFRHVGLLLQRLELATELRQHVLQAEDVLLDRAQLPLGALAAASMLGDAGRLLDVLAALLGPGSEDVLELVLADHGVERAADAGLGQQLLDVQEPRGASSHEVLALTRAVHGPGDLDLGQRDRDDPGAVVDDQRDLGHPEALTSRRSGEDHVGHRGPPESARALLPEHPRDRIDQVRLARTVGTDDDGDARLELEGGAVREGFEAANVEGPEEHSGGRS
jgi:hypothetical protein